VNSGNLRQTWEIFRITIYSILRETQTIFGEQKNKELVNVILKAFEVLKLKKDHVVKTRVSKNYKIEYMEGRHYGILLR